MLQKDYKTRQVGTRRPKKVLGTFTYPLDFYPLTVPLSYVAFLTKCVIPLLSSAKLSLEDKTNYNNSSIPRSRRIEITIGQLKSENCRKPPYLSLNNSLKL